MKQLKFWKSEDGIWYYDFPNYTAMGGDQSDLAMVAGADVLLDELSNYENACEVTLTDTDPDIVLKRENVHDLGFGGATYIIESKVDWMKQMHNKQAWLCPVTMLVFKGKYPKTISIKKINTIL